MNVAKIKKSWKNQAEFEEKQVVYGNELIMTTSEVFSIDAVEENILSVLSSNSSDQITDESEADHDVSFHLLAEQIPVAFSPSKDETSVKMLVRSHGLGTLRPERKLIWKTCYVRLEASAGATLDVENANSLVEANENMYHDTVRTCFGSLDLPDGEPALPGCVDEKHCNSYYLSRNGKISVGRILTCLGYNQPDVQYCPMLFPIAATIRHFLTEEDTYGIVSAMASSKNTKYFFQSTLQMAVSSQTALELSKKHAKKSVSYLESASNQEQVERLYEEWIWWILDGLPFPHVVRILDSFLIEGNKILYGICFTLLHMFTEALRGNDAKWKGSIKNRGLKGAMYHFCKEIPCSPNALLNRCFKFRGFSRAEINKIAVQVEMDLKSRGIVNGFKTRSQSADNFPSPDCRDRINAESTTLAYKELVALWNWLPERMTMATPTLAYSSNEHGISLTTFYTRCEKYEPTILVIKTTQGEVFGAYCSTTWAERNLKNDKGSRQVYFGTGETFLFQLPTGGTPKKYAWVKADSRSSSSSKPESETSTKAEEHKKELFMCGQHDMIAIGGGDGNGICLDASLTIGKTEHCATFGNPPLCNSRDFTIAAIEVYGLFKLDL